VNERSSRAPRAPPRRRSAAASAPALSPPQPQYRYMLQGFSPAVVTGKPLHLHGSLGRDTAVAHGLQIAVREFTRRSLFSRTAGTTFAIQARG